MTSACNGFDGDTGATVFSGGGANELMANTRRFNTGIARARRIYIANDGAGLRLHRASFADSPELRQASLPKRHIRVEFHSQRPRSMNFSIYSTTNAYLPSQELAAHGDRLGNFIRPVPPSTDPVWRHGTPPASITPRHFALSGCSINGARAIFPLLFAPRLLRFIRRE